MNDNKLYMLLIENMRSLSEQYKEALSNEAKFKEELEKVVKLKYKLEGSLEVVQFLQMKLMEQDKEQDNAGKK